MVRPLYDQHMVDRSYYLAYACERTELEVKCEEGRKIAIVHAMYGRQNMRQCNEGQTATDAWSTFCAAPQRRTHYIIKSRCNGMEECLIPAVNEMFGDPCPNTYKYLEVYYSCISDNY